MKCPSHAGAGLYFKSDLLMVLLRNALISNAPGNCSVFTKKGSHCKSEKHQESLRVVARPGGKWSHCRDRPSDEAAVRKSRMDFYTNHLISNFEKEIWDVGTFHCVK